MNPIAVRTYGAGGATVVVLHGGPGAPGSAAGLARGLATRFKVLEPLQRRAGEVPLTVAQHVADLTEVAPSPAALVGWSWGAMLALSYASAHPQRVSAVVLVGCGTFSEADRLEYRRRMNARLGEAGLRRLEALRQALQVETDGPTRDRLLGEQGALATQAQSVELLDEADTDALEPDARGSQETWDDVLRRQASHLEPAAFASVRAPVLMIHGDADPHPGAATRDTLRPYLPQLEYVELERCGHLPWREQHARARFFHVLGDWLAGQPSR
ncbi:MAG: alpha/beta hydrolase [Myxococcaceae bacterium]|nr:alpha/beta hydrolase [Myxococcaceae bacterium]